MLTNKDSVDFEIRDQIKDIVIHYRDEVKKLFPNSEIYLFGSISKGFIKDSSDVDLLVILPNQKLSSVEKKDNKILTYSLDYYKRDLDCKVYGEIDFLNSVGHGLFEKCILKDLININRW